MVPRQRRVLAGGRGRRVRTLERGRRLIASFLIDESVTPSLVRVARSHGYFATSVRDLGMLGASDPDVFREALRLGSTLVTANPRDFEVLARRSPGHHGLVVFRCSLPREVSIRLFEGWLAGHVTLSAPTGMRVRLEPGMPPLVESLT